MKRLVVCCDGTWNRPDQKHPTNVVKMSRAIAPKGADGTPQVVFYDRGVGTGNLLDRLTGGAFGTGLERNVEDAYRFLMHNYEDDDQIFLFGFSRGAYTARSAAGLIRKCGLLRKADADQFRQAYDFYRRRDATPDAADVARFRERYSREIDIHFIGVWDTVGARGIPLRGVRWLRRDRYQFHNMRLSRRVKNAFHAVAIDERRGPFTPSLWEAVRKEGQRVEQAWFTGVHSDIGGGYREGGLADIAFTWMKEKAEQCGLGLDEDYVNDFVKPNPIDVLHNSMTGFYRITPGRTRQIGQNANEAAHACAVLRFKGDRQAYDPTNLREYLESPEPNVAESGICPPEPTDEE